MTHSEKNKRAPTLEQESGWRDLPPCPGWRQHPFRSVYWLTHAILAAICLLILLAITAAIPGLNFYALGYLLNAQGRVALSGRLRDALTLLPAARRLLVIVCGLAVLAVPVGWLSGVVREAWLISSGNTTVWLLTVAWVLACLLIAIHACRAVLRGGSLIDFLRIDRTLRWLLSRGRSGQVDLQSMTGTELLSALQVGQNLRVGLIGCAAVHALLALPTWATSALHDQSRLIERILLAFGVVVLTLMLGVLPFLVAQFAATGQVTQLIGFRLALRRFGNAPFAHLTAIVVLFGLSVPVPLYQALLKLQLPPHGVVWDLMLVTIVLTLPGRILVAWAWHRGEQPRRGWRVWRWLCGILVVAATGSYVAFLLLAAGGGQLGSRVLWQHHELILPLHGVF